MKEEEDAAMSWMEYTVCATIGEFSTCFVVRTTYTEMRLVQKFLRPSPPRSTDRPTLAATPADSDQGSTNTQRVRTIVGGRAYAL